MISVFVPAGRHGPASGRWCQHDAELVVGAIQVENGLEASSRLLRAFRYEQGNAFAVNGLPVLRAVAKDANDERKSPLDLTEIKQVIGQLQEPARALRGGGLAMPDQARLVDFAELQQQRYQPVLGTSGCNLGQLLLKSQGRRQVPFLLGQRAVSCCQERDVARLVGEEAFAARAARCRDRPQLGGPRRYRA